MYNFTPYSALAGGALIGAAASGFLLAHGRVAGVSDLVAGLMHSGDQARTIRFWFVAGLLAVGVLARQITPAAFGTGQGGLTSAAVAGLLVGFGTRLGNGCTSGHGVCGISRGSRRSLIATVVFMVSGIATVAILHLLGVYR